MIITDDPEAIRRVLMGSKTIAVVGCSNKPDRDSYQIAQALINRGYDVIPVNPGATEILGRKCYPDVKSIPQKVDIVPGELHQKVPFVTGSPEDVDHYQDFFLGGDGPPKKKGAK